jgi:hypothetical protein
MKGLGMENVGKFYGILKYCTATWYILWSFCIQFPILVCCTKKHLATQLLAFVITPESKHVELLEVFHQSQERVVQLALLQVDVAGVNLDANLNPKEGCQLLYSHTKYTNFGLFYG